MKNAMRYIGSVICLMMIFACGSNTSQSGNQQVAFQTIEQVGVAPKANNPITTPNVYVLRSATEWTEFWNVFALTIPTSMPTIDFSQNQFVAVVDGIQSTGGHSITITGVETNSTGVVVSAVETSPGQGCVTTQVIDQPVHVIMTPTFSGGAILRLTQNVTTCN